MAAPSYATDLTTIVDFDGTSYTPSEPASGWTAGRSPTTDTDFPIQSSTHASLTMNTTGKAGMVVSATSWTWNTSHYLFGWIVWLAPGAIDTKANGGLAMLCGNTTSDYKIFYVGGKDFGSYPYGGWQNFIVDPTKTGGEANNGTPNGTNFNVVGAGANVLSSVSKGNPLGFDKFTYGRGEFRVAAGESGNYATFAGMATTNDNTSNRWGLFQAIDGGYRFAGHMILGYAALVNFVDSNRYIVVKNTPEVNSDFHKIEIRNASSVVTWDNIAITQLGVTGTYTTASKCSFVMTDNADVNLSSCTFTDMSTFVFLSNATTIDSIFRRCGQVTLGGSTMSGCTFDKSTATVALACGSSVTGLSDTSFVSSGTGHAIEITSGTSHTLNGISFSGYAATSGSTGNEAVYVNIGSGNVTIYADSTFSYRTAGATVTIVAGAVPITVTVTNVSGTAISGAAVALYAKDGTGDLPYKDTVTISNSGTTATVSHTAHGMVTGDKVLIEGGDQYYNRGVFSITKISDNSYSYTMAGTPGANPTGTITATWAALYGTTDANGEITTSRVISTDQPVSGWARKSTSAPYYKTGPINGIIDTADGAPALTAILLSDQ